MIYQIHICIFRCLNPFEKLGQGSENMNMFENYYFQNFLRTLGNRESAADVVKDFGFLENSY